jgi:translation initiation factor IF-3
VEIRIETERKGRQKETDGHHGFLGRELAHQDQGRKVLARVQAGLLDIAVIESPPKMEGKQMFLLLAPDPVKVKEYLKSQPKPAAPTDEEIEADTAMAEEA